MPDHEDKRPDPDQPPTPATAQDNDRMQATVMDARMLETVPPGSVDSLDELEQRVATSTPTPAAPSSPVKSATGEADSKSGSESGSKSDQAGLDWLQPGAQVHKYQLIRKLGSGGMGSVFLARDTRLGRRVALKFLHLTDPVFSERFLDEARTTAQCIHENIVVLYEAEEYEGVPYMVLEYLEGESLREILDRKIRERGNARLLMPQAQALDIIIPVVHALVRAHAMGIVHRDLKPANIMRTRSGVVKVLDFGISKALEMERTEERSGEHMYLLGRTMTQLSHGIEGTLPYMSPEQILNATIDARTDLWAVGIILHEMLTGDHPLAPLTPTKLDRAARGKVPIPSVGDTLSEFAAIGAVVDQCLQVSLDDRMASASALLKALQQLVPGSQARKRPAVLSKSTIQARVPALTARVVPALTVAAHPDAEMVGARALLGDLAVGGAVEISRVTPDFVKPGSPFGAPLSDPFVSRRPVRLVLGKDGAVALSVEPGGTHVVCGELVEDRISIAAAELERGVPIELAERVLLVLHRHERALVAGGNDFGMVGASTSMQRVRAAIQRVRDLDLPVLIHGESGTGRQLVARAIHDSGPRRNGPFVVVNLAALAPDMAAVDLFGAQDGGREGYLQAAAGGTVFLRKVEKAAPRVQDMLLRTLKSKQITPVGARSPVPCDVRVVTATDVNLKDYVDAGQFKQALLQQLAGFQVKVPPLRERREDIGPLFYHFARELLTVLGEAHRLAPEDPSADAWLPAGLAAQLVRYRWPGNVSQLRETVRQLVIGSRGQPSLHLDPDLADELASSS